MASTTNVTRKIRRKTLDHERSEDRFAALLSEVKQAAEHLKVPEGTRILVAYEAGQECFWIVRALRERGIEAEVIDPVSLQVDRKQKHVKTDRLDSEALVLALLRYMGGEVRALRMLRVPSKEAEDSREWQRERDRLEGERRGCTDRLKKKLRGHGIWVLPKTWRSDLRGNTMRCFSGDPLGPLLTVALCIELDRLEHAEAKLDALKDKLELVDAAACERIDRLELIRGIGRTSATALSLKLFWRTFRNRRQLGSCVGMVGTPYDSGTTTQDQGISKTGDPSLRGLIVELSWLWLKFQPMSGMSQWFAKRTAGGGKRHKRVMIVALGRKLVIALWRYLEHGVIPDGAVLKKQAA